MSEDAVSKLDDDQANESKEEASSADIRHDEGGDESNEMKELKDFQSSDSSKEAISEMTKDSSPSRQRFSHHSLSFSGDSNLAELISKARSDFSQTLKEDMKRFDSHSPRLSERSRRLPDLNENTLFADMMDGDKSPRINRANLKLNLKKGTSLSSNGSSYESSALDSPTHSDTPIADSFSLTPRRGEEPSRLLSPRTSEGNIRLLSPRNSDASIRSLSQKLNEINAVNHNGETSSPRLNGNKESNDTTDEISQEIINALEHKPGYEELKEKIQKQDNEILILKTALANVVRRLETLEAERKQKGGGLKESWGNMKGMLPAAAILPSQPKSPVKGIKDSVDDESPRSPDKEKTSIIKKHQLSRRASDVPKRSPSPSLSSQTPQLSSSLDKRRGSLTRRSTTDLRRSGSIGNLSNGDKDENAAVKFYIRGRAVNTYAPSNFIESKKAGGAPDKKLRLEWVYGYRGRDSRNNLLTLATGEVVYHIAAVVIIYDRYTGEQRHYLGHNDDIKCIAIHPDKIIVASGQVAGHDKDEGKPHVRIWDSNTLETLHVIGIGYFERALCCLAFSIKDGGKLLASIDEANEHVISLWDWEKKLRYSENKSSNEAVLGVIFHPHNNNVMISHGRSHIAFWSINEDMKVTKKMGIFERHGKPKFVLCATFTENGDLLSGDSNGNILVWGQGTNRVTKAVKEAHDGAIFSICCMSDGKILSGGGKDRKIIEWNQYLQKTGYEVELPECSGQVRAIAEGQIQDDDTVDIIVGTTKNCILDGSLSSGLGIIVQGHVDELWGLATHPSKDIFVTCSTDEKVILWDAESHDAIWTKQLKESAQSAAFHPFANVLVIGTKSGRWIVLDSDTTEEIATFHDGPEQHDAIKYSRDGKYIAVGSHDNFIYLYTVSEDGKTYKKAGKLSGHSSFITHLDWSKDGQFLQSNSGDYEILFWNAPSCRQIVTPCSMKDIEWDTWTCVLGFPVIGIWPEGADGTDINACCRSSNCEHVVTGDDFGQVNFFSYPSTKPKSDCQHCIGHSSHVTCVRFMHDDTTVISVGGKDCSVMQWRIS